jgi:hypothetical protein
MPCPLCHKEKQNLILHFKREHPEDLGRLTSFLVQGCGEEALRLNEEILKNRSKVDRLWRWDRFPTYIYFVQAGGPGRPVKIGYSNHLTNRLIGMQTGCPDPLEVLLAVKGERGDEADLHRRFKGLRIHGEWFRADLELLRYIQELKDSSPAVAEHYRGSSLDKYRELKNKIKDRGAKLSFQECRRIAREAGLRTAKGWADMHRQGLLPKGAPSNLPREFPNQWTGWPSFLGLSLQRRKRWSKGACSLSLFGPREPAKLRGLLGL